MVRPVYVFTCRCGCDFRKLQNDAAAPSSIRWWEKKSLLIRWSENPHNSSPLPLFIFYFFFPFSENFLSLKKELFSSSVSFPHNCPHSFPWAYSFEPLNMLSLHVGNHLLKPSWSLPISVPLWPAEYAFSMRLRISLHSEHNSLFRPCTHFIFLFSFTKTSYGNFPSFKGLGILSKVDSSAFPEVETIQVVKSQYWFH